MMWVNNKHFFRFDGLSRTAARGKCVRSMEGYIGDQPGLSGYVALVTKARDQKTENEHRKTNITYAIGYVEAF